MPSACGAIIRDGERIGQLCSVLTPDLCSDHSDYVFRRVPFEFYAWYDLNDNTTIPPLGDTWHNQNIKLPHELRPEQLERGYSNLTNEEKYIHVSSSAMFILPQTTLTINGSITDSVPRYNLVINNNTTVTGGTVFYTPQVATPVVSGGAVFHTPQTYSIAQKISEQDISDLLDRASSVMKIDKTQVWMDLLYSLVYPRLKKYPITSESTQCVICMDDVDTDRVQAKLDCGHSFHYKCIGRWTENKSSCPSCRTKIQ